MFAMPCDCIANDDKNSGVDSPCTLDNNGCKLLPPELDFTLVKVPEESSCCEEALPPALALLVMDWARFTPAMQPGV